MKNKTYSDGSKVLPDEFDTIVELAVDKIKALQEI
jgi:hypothetical protein